MSKLLLPSIVAATLAVPIFGARDADPRRGMKRALGAMLVVEGLYLAVAMFLVPAS